MTAPTDDELIAELRKPWRQLGNGPVMRSHLQCSAADRLVELLAENEALRRNHLGEGTFRCTCTSYPHAPNCGLDERLAAALERERKLREDNDILRATCTAREEYAADIAALRADAERYRMIRPKGSQWSAVVCFLPHEDQLKRHTFYEGDALDAAIDAAIAKGGAA